MEKNMRRFYSSLELRNYSSATIESHRGSLESFMKWSFERGKRDVREVTEDDLYAFLKYCREKQYARHTVDNRMRSVKAFFDFLEKEQSIFINPAEWLELPGLGDRSPKVILTEKEMERLLKAPNLSRKLGIRDRAIMEVLYSTAIRNAECVALTVFDVDLEAGYVRVNQGKGRKDRMVPLGKKAVAYLKRYLENVRPGLLKDMDDHALFFSRTGKALDGQSLNLLVRTYGRNLGLAKPVTTHSFRRAAITHMLRRGAHPLYLQRMLGHATGETVRRYVKLSAKDIKDAHRKHHPAERERKA